MPTPCTHTKPNGQPCRADALPDSSLCLFHDPRHHDTLAAARGKGGAAPRRRVRRLPPILDHLHVAQLLSELLVEAVNETDPANPRQLQAVTGLSRALLKAVGVPNTYAAHGDRSEPPPTSDHLLRRYRPQPVEAEALPEGSAPADTNAPPPMEPDPAPLPTLQVTSLRAYHAGHSLLSLPGRAGSTPPASPVETSHSSPTIASLPSPPESLAVAPVEPLDSLSADPLPGESDPEQEAEQGGNRDWTGLPATELFSAPGDRADQQTALPSLGLASWEPDEDLLRWLSRPPPPRRCPGGVPQALGSTRPRPWVDPFR